MRSRRLMPSQRLPPPQRRRHHPGGSRLMARGPDGAAVAPDAPGAWGPGRERGKQPAPWSRTSSPSRLIGVPPQEVVAALWPEAGRSQTSARPRPVATARHATRAGKAVAMTRWVQRVSPRAGTHRQHRVALTAGAASVPHQLVRHLPAYTRGLASIHATASLWDTAHVWLGATHPHRTAWVRSSLEPVLAGPREAVSTALHAEAPDPVGTATQRHAVQRPIGDSRRPRPVRRSGRTSPRAGPLARG